MISALLEKPETGRGGRGLDDREKYKIGIARTSRYEIDTQHPASAFEGRREFAIVRANDYESARIICEDETIDAFIIDDTIAKQKNITANEREYLMGLRELNYDAPMLLYGDSEFLQLAAECEFDAYVKRELGGSGWLANGFVLPMITKELITEGFSKYIANASSRPDAFWQKNKR